MNKPESLPPIAEVYYQPPEGKSRKTLYIFIGIIAVSVVCIVVGAYLLIDWYSDLTGWREVADKRGQFKVKMPARPRLTSNKVDTPAGEINIDGYEVVLDDVTYIVSYIDLKLHGIRFSIENAKDGIVRRMGGKGINEKELLLQGFQCSEIELETTTPKGYAIVRLIKAKNKVYQIVVAAPNKEAIGADAKKFMDSFQITIPLTFATRVEPFLGAAVDLKNKRLFLSTRDRKLLVYSYPEFQKLATYNLAEIATHLCLDTQQGLLFATAVTPKKMLPRHPYSEQDKLGRGDLVVYDVKDILAGKQLQANSLRRIQTLELNATIGQMLISPDEQWLYYLDVGNLGQPKANQRIHSVEVWNNPPKNVKLVKLDTATQKQRRVLPLPDGTEHFCLTPNGKMIYAVTAPHGYDHYRESHRPGSPLKFEKGLLHVIRTDPMTINDTIKLPLDPYYVVADNEGNAYIGGGSNQWTELINVNVQKRKIIKRLEHFYMFSPIAVTPNGEWLLIADTVGTRPGSIELHSLTGAINRHSLHFAIDELRSIDDKFPLAGEFILTPDSKYLLFKKGSVVRFIMP